MLLLLFTQCLSSLFLTRSVLGVTSTAAVSCNDVSTDACRLLVAAAPNFCTTPQANVECPSFCGLCCEFHSCQFVYCFCLIQKYFTYIKTYPYSLYLSTGFLFNVSQCICLSHWMFVICSSYGGDGSSLGRGRARIVFAGRYPLLAQVCCCNIFSLISLKFHKDDMPT